MSRKMIMVLCICMILICVVYVVVQLRRRRPPRIYYLYVAGWIAAAVAAVFLKQRAMLVLPAMIYSLFRRRVQQDRKERKDPEPEDEFWKAERDAENRLRSERSLDTHGWD